MIEGRVGGTHLGDDQARDFYHHHCSKEAVLATGCEHASGLRCDGQSVVQAAGGDASTQLQDAAATLLAFQLSAHGPPMRACALHSLATAKRHAMIERANRVTARFPGMIADGAAGRTIRLVDPLIIAQMVTAATNAAAVVWLCAPQDLERARDGHYCAPMPYGLFVPTHGVRA